MDLDENENREVAATVLKKLQGPLFEYKFPPRADVCLEGMFTITLSLFASLLTQILYRYA